MLEGQADAIAEGPGALSGVLVDVRRALAVRLPRGEAEIEVVARDLGMSTRTLQRRLSSFGVSYQELVDAVRRESAEKCIADSSPSIGEIAYLVGYSEPAHFTAPSGAGPVSLHRRSDRDGNHCEALSASAGFSRARLADREVAGDNGDSEDHECDARVRQAVARVCLERGLEE